MAHPEYKQRFIDKVQEYFFNGGAMMPAASIARLNAARERVRPGDHCRGSPLGRLQGSPAAQ